MVQVIMPFLKLLLLVLVSTLTVSTFDVMMVIGSYQHFTYRAWVYCIFIVQLVQVYLRIRRDEADTKVLVVKLTLH